MSKREQLRDLARQRVEASWPGCRHPMDPQGAESQSATTRAEDLSAQVLTPDHPLFRLQGRGRSGGGPPSARDKYGLELMSQSPATQQIPSELREAVLRALTGEGAHVQSASALAGLDWRFAGTRPDGAPHSAFEIVNHLVYWQDHALAWLAGDKPATPKHDADSWPGPAAPASAEVWDAAVARFTAGVEHLVRHAREDDLLARRGPKTVLYILQIVAAHDSYHLGQVVLLRQQLGAWPPPGGGFTW